MSTIEVFPTDRKQITNQSRDKVVKHNTRGHLQQCQVFHLLIPIGWNCSKSVRV